jgi:hypothetical protein
MTWRRFLAVSRARLPMPNREPARCASLLGMRNGRRRLLLGAMVLGLWIGDPVRALAPRSPAGPRDPPSRAAEHQQGEGFAGPVGGGYRHRLVWTFDFRRPPELATWEVIVDAHDGEVLAFQDLNHYADKSITGGVYPITNTGVCPTPQTCGTMQGTGPCPSPTAGSPGSAS